ncbi:hypothetical protein [uncultured Nocardioides sp.]|uniref:hypothetical protein n=1 Tax=uncultured Nocardioides sp. TaxID=198441 RepID=UPI000C4B215B|nr:hypothetical protein [Nocardioides sp.]
MAEEKRGPVRRSPFDDLTPADFVEGRWPHGRLVVPEEAFRRYGLTRTQGVAHMRAVRDLRQLVLDYEKYLQVKGRTQKAYAAHVGVSVNRLSALRSGTSWPSWRLVGILRATIPTQAVLDRGELAGELPDDA